MHPIHVRFIVFEIDILLRLTGQIYDNVPCRNNALLPVDKEMPLPCCNVQQLIILSPFWTTRPEFGTFFHLVVSAARHYKRLAFVRYGNCRIVQISSIYKHFQIPLFIISQVYHICCGFSRAFCSFVHIFDRNVYSS